MVSLFTRAIMQPKMQKPPGAMERMAMGLSLSQGMGMPRKVPLPKTSRMQAMAVSARVKPKPMPTPSSAESSTVFLLANISARPKMMQLTTMSERYTPRDS